MEKARMSGKNGRYWQIKLRAKTKTIHSPAQKHDDTQ